MNKRLALVGLISGLLADLGAANAQSSVSVTSGVEQIENPSLSVSSPGAATVLRVVPSYAYETQGERIRSRLSLGAVIERSSDTAVLASRNYPNLGYTWTYSWPTASLDLRASLAEANTRNTELEELGRITVDSRERSVLAGARWSQEVTARTRVELELVNSRLSYDSALLDGFRELQVSSRASWEATERLVYYVEPAYARLTSSGRATETTRKRWLAGVRGELLPGWSLATHVGQARTSDPRPATGNVAGLQLAFEGSRWSSGVEWSQDVTPSAATTAYVRTRALGLRLGYRVTEGATVSAEVTRSQSSGVEGARGQVSSLALNNELSANWSSTMGVEDRRTRAEGARTARGWALRASLTYAYPGR
jgi:hypothetical protein